jgi:hypothetical protein
MPADVESFGRAAVPNPYRGLGPNHATTGANMLVDKFKRMLYIGVSGFFLHRMNFWGAIVRSPHVSHEWFKLGVAGTIGTFMVVYQLFSESATSSSRSPRFSNGQ